METYILVASLILVIIWSVSNEVVSYIVFGFMLGFVCASLWTYVFNPFR